MKIQPKVRGFICTTAHPDGCRENVRRQIAYMQKAPGSCPAKKVLVIGSSTGYGLASRIACAFAGNAATLGVMFERPASGNRTATAGWYNTAAFEEFANKAGLYAKTINGDAFSSEIKQQTVAAIKADLGKVDMVVYSLAAPRRTLPDGTTVSSVLKTTGGDYTNKTIDLKTGTVSDITIPAATEEEIANTIKVMGGEDWKDWIAALTEADAIQPDAVTVAYSYIGPDITHPIYADGSIGRAKQHLYRTADEITAEFGGIKGVVSVNKALVTQSSAAIPVVPLYISILYKVMKQKSLHEGCIEQMQRLFTDKLPNMKTDQNGLIRMDDWEMQPDVQTAVMQAWQNIATENVGELADVDGYWEDFYHMFGFHLDGVDTDTDTDPARTIPSLAS